MSIRVGKYNYKTKKEPITPGYANVLIHTTGDLSPYTMKDENGAIMENYWQFSKIWETVDSIKQPLSQYMPNRIRWEHPEETHMKNGKVTDGYWKWREKGFKHFRWVRYPNGFRNHSKAAGSVYKTKDGYRILGYIEARKKIYFTKYCEIARTTKQFKELKSILDKGGRIQINEVDGPRYDEEHPYNLTENGSIEITEAILRALINNPKQAFGHGYTLAACLLDIDLSTSHDDTLIIWTNSCAKAGYGVYFEGSIPPGWDISKRLKGSQTSIRAELYAVYSALKRVYWRSTQQKHLHFRICNKLALDALLQNGKSDAHWDIIEKLCKVRNVLKKQGYQITGERANSDVPGYKNACELSHRGSKK